MKARQPKQDKALYERAPTPQPGKLGKLRAAATSLSLILIVALLLRVGFAWNYVTHNPRQALSVIPFMFESGNIAYSLANGNGFSSPFRVDTGPTAWMTPVYPLLLAGVFRTFGVYTFASYIVAAGLNILFATLACIPIYFAGKRIGGPGLGALAAWLWAVFPNAIQIPTESMWDASLAALLAATILWATLALAESQRLRDRCGYGLLWGLALMTNPTLASSLPFLLGWIAWRGRNRGRSWLAGPALAAVIVVLCCVPWTIRNYMVFHAFVPLRSVLGLQLAMGNNAETRDIWLGEGHPIHDAAERETYIQMGEIAYMKMKQRQAIDYIVSHPRREMQLMGRRFLSLWSGGTPRPLRSLILVHSLWFRSVLIFNLFVAVGTLVGIVAFGVAARHLRISAGCLPNRFPVGVLLHSGLAALSHAHRSHPDLARGNRSSGLVESKSSRPAVRRI